MNTTEAFFTFCWGLFQLFGSICCFFVAFDYLRMLGRDSRIEREIRKMYALANEVDDPLYSGAVFRFAELFGVDLDGND